MKKIKFLENNRQSLIEAHLHHYEEAEDQLVQLKQVHQEVFRELEELEAVKEEAKESLKRLLYTKGGPPPEAGGKTTHTWAEGEIFCVRVQYKRKADHYDPEAVPEQYLLIPGVVTEVSKEALEELLTEEEKKHALVKGEFITPALTITRKS
jgi:hypothetical protein